MPSAPKILIAGLLLAVVSAPAMAQNFPTHPVRVLVGFAAGSGPDIQARTIAQQLQTDLGQSFYVENRLGANGTIAARTVAQSEPDGYALLSTSSSIAPTPHIYKNLGYDTMKDLAPIATTGILDGLFMLVDAKSPIHTVQEFIAHAKKDRVLYGSPGVGNGLHLAAELFSQAAGIKMQHVPYKGASEVMNGLLNGSIEVMFVTPPSSLGLVKDGRVRALAFTGTKPFPETPDVPLMKDVLPNLEPIGSWGMVFAQGKTPKPIIDTLNAAIQKALAAPAVAGVMKRDGYLPDHRNADQTAAFFRDEVKRAGEAVKAAGIQPN